MVWWDPTVLRLDVEQSVGLRQDKLLQADQGGQVAASGVEAHAHWQSRRQQSLDKGTQCAMRVETVTRAAAAPAAAAVQTVDLEVVAGNRAGRPRGKRFGALVHAILAVVDLDADAEGVRSTARAQGSLMGAPPQELEAAEQAVVDALRHPILRRAAAAKESLRRESPIMLPLDDGQIIEGVLDLAFREEVDGRGQWTVVDFKTDAELGARRAIYEEQLRLYVRAVEAATREGARGVLLVV